MIKELVKDQAILSQRCEKATADDADDREPPVEKEGPTDAEAQA